MGEIYTGRPGVCRCEHPEHLPGFECPLVMLPPGDCDCGLEHPSGCACAVYTPRVTEN